MCTYITRANYAARCSCFDMEMGLLRDEYVCVCVYFICWFSFYQDLSQMFALFFHHLHRRFLLLLVAWCKLLRAKKIVRMPFYFVRHLRCCNKSKIEGKIECEHKHDSHITFAPLLNVELLSRIYVWASGWERERAFKPNIQFILNLLTRKMPFLLTFFLIFFSCPFLVSFFVEISSKMISAKTPRIAVKSKIFFLLSALFVVINCDSMLPEVFFYSFGEWMNIIWRMWARC